MDILNDKEKITEGFMQGINICNIEVMKIIKNNFEEVKPYFPLIGFIVERLSTVTDLAIRGYNWDAEIIYRSALEAFVKFNYMATANEEERKIRQKEYWEDLFEINALKLSEQAKKSLSVHKYDDTARLAFKPMVLTEQMESFLREKWPRVDRKKLEQKWSVTEMIVSLAKIDRSIIGFSHNYRYASHVTHADETGVLMINEREQRSDEEREIANMAHYVRLLSDAFFFCATIGIQVCMLTKTKSNFFSELVKSTSEIYQLGIKYLEKLQEDKIYDKHR